MPLYTITMQTGVLDDQAKTDLAGQLTSFHSEYAAVPKNWVHVVFHEYTVGCGFTAGRPSPTAAHNGRRCSRHAAQCCFRCSGVT